MIYVLFGIAVAAVVGVYGWMVYNRVTSLTNTINESWANVTASLKKRHDTIPLLVDIVKGNKDYEKLVQTSQTAIHGQDINAVSEAERSIQKSVVAVVEAYPEIKADAAFKDLLDQLVKIEDEIQGNRLLFNRAVALYRRQLGSFPAGVFAAAFGFTGLDFFEVDPGLK